MPAEEVKQARRKLVGHGLDLFQVVEDGIGSASGLHVGKQVRAEDDGPPAGAVGAGGQDGVVAEEGQGVVERFGDLVGGFGVEVVGRVDDCNDEVHERRHDKSPVSSWTMLHTIHIRSGCPVKSRRFPDNSSIHFRQETDWNSGEVVHL
jgi:hypothetical protein